MPRTELVQLVNREAQTSDTAVYRKDLPKAGKVSAIDIGIRITNGATPPTDKEIFDAINSISLVVNGTEYRYKMTGHDFFRYNWMKHGAPMSYNFDETASAVQEAWFRMDFGRYIGDPNYFLDLSKHNNVQVQVDYALSSFGTVGTHVITATFTVTILMHQFPLNSPVVAKGCFGAREFYSKTSVASAVTPLDSPSQYPIMGYAIACREDNVAEGTDISDIRIGSDLFQKLFVSGKWYNFQAKNNEQLLIRKMTQVLYLTSAETRALLLANLDYAGVVPNAATGGAA